MTLWGPIPKNKPKKGIFFYFFQLEIKHSMAQMAYILLRLLEFFNLYLKNPFSQAT